MSRWTSSLRLRRDLLAVCACLAAFACPAAAWAAGGTPMPAPDDPPGGFRHVVLDGDQVLEVDPVLETRSSRAHARRPGGRLVRGSGPDKATGRRQDRDGDARARGLAAVEPGSDAAPGLHVARPRRVPRRPRRSRARSRGRSRLGRRSRSATHRSPRQEARDRLPRDHAARRVRLGLPAAVLAAATGTAMPARAALLVAAALLLAVAAGGSTVLGVAARSATRQA